MRVYERIHTFSHGVFEVRMWCACTSDGTDTEADWQMSVIKGVFDGSYMTQKNIAEALSNLPFCNAVEVMRLDPPWDGVNSGLLIYPDWP